MLFVTLQTVWKSVSKFHQQNSVLHSLHDTSGEVLFVNFKSMINHTSNYTVTEHFKAVFEERCREMFMERKAHRVTSPAGMLINSGNWIFIFTIFSQWWGMRLCWCWVLPSVGFKLVATTGRHTLSHINQVSSLETDRKGFITDLFWAKQANEIDRDRPKDTKTLWMIKANLRLHGMDDGKREGAPEPFFTASCWWAWRLNTQRHLDVHLKLRVITLKRHKHISLTKHKLLCCIRINL